jgi:hypothetical protein
MSIFLNNLQANNFNIIYTKSNAWSRNEMGAKII